MRLLQQIDAQGPLGQVSQVREIPHEQTGGAQALFTCEPTCLTSTGESHDLGIYLILGDLTLSVQFADTADYCQRHEAETGLIPWGLSKGWPSRIDFDKLHM